MSKSQLTSKLFKIPEAGSGMWNICELMPTTSYIIVFIVWKHISRDDDDPQLNTARRQLSRRRLFPTALD